MKRDFFPDNFLGGEDLELEPQTIHGTFVLAKIHKKSRRKNWDRFQSPRRSRNQNFSLNFLLFLGGPPPCKVPLMVPILVPLESIGVGRQPCLFLPACLPASRRLSVETERLGMQRKCDRSGRTWSPPSYRAAGGARQGAGGDLGAGGDFRDASGIFRHGAEDACFVGGAPGEAGGIPHGAGGFLRGAGGGPRGTGGRA